MADCMNKLYNSEIKLHNVPVIMQFAGGDQNLNQHVFNSGGK